MRPSDPITSCPYCGAPVEPHVEPGYWMIACVCGNEWERETAPTVADLLRDALAGSPAFLAAVLAP